MTCQSNGPTIRNDRDQNHPARSGPASLRCDHDTRPSRGRCRPCRPAAHALAERSQFPCSSQTRSLKAPGLIHSSVPTATATFWAFHFMMSRVSSTICSSVKWRCSSSTIASLSDDGCVIIASASASAARWSAGKSSVVPESTSPIVSSSSPASLATAKRTDSQVPQSWWWAQRIRTSSVVTGSIVARRTVAAAKRPSALRRSRSQCVPGATRTDRSIRLLRTVGPTRAAGGCAVRSPAARSRSSAGRRRPGALELRRPCCRRSRRHR